MVLVKIPKTNWLATQPKVKERI